MFQRRILQATLTICAAMALTQRCTRAQQSYEVIVQNGVAMKTRDGVTLNADIYRPKADGKFPVIMMRTPYDKSVAGRPLRRIRLRRMATLSSCKMFADGTLQKGNFTHSATSQPTGTTRSNGLLSCRSRAAKSG